MFHLVTGYFTWHLLAWSAIFFFSAFLLTQLLRFAKKRMGIYVSNEGTEKNDDPSMDDVSKNMGWRTFIDNAFGFWFTLPQAQLLLLAAIVLFFFLAVWGGGNGGDAI